MQIDVLSWSVFVRCIRTTNEGGSDNRDEEHFVNAIARSRSQ